MTRADSPHRILCDTPSLPSSFYRDEFIKHREVLARQREYFSEHAITNADEALAKVLGRLDQICECDGAEQLIGRLLRTFNAVTGLSNWSDPKQLN